MADQPLFLRSDADLEAALRDLSGSIAWPEADRATDGARDIAAAVRARLETAPPRTRGWTWRPARRAMVLAVAILLALAAVAAATGFGLPGLRLIFGPPPASISPPPSLEPSRSPAAGAPGASMSLGRQVDLADLDAEAGFAVTWPDDPSIGPPDAAYIDDYRRGQVEPRLGVAARAARHAGARGRSPHERVPRHGRQRRHQQDRVGRRDRQLVSVNGERGWWVSGDPHFFFYEGPNGVVSDERRWVGDVLLWADGPITHRLETSLGEAAAGRRTTPESMGPDFALRRFSGLLQHKQSGSTGSDGSRLPEAESPNARLASRHRVVAILAVVIGGFVAYDQVLRGDSAAALTLPRRDREPGRHDRTPPRPPPRQAAPPPRPAPARRRWRCRGHLDRGRRQRRGLPRPRAARQPAGRERRGRTDGPGDRLDHRRDVRRDDDDPDRGDPDRGHDQPEPRTNRGATTGCATKVSRPTRSRPRRSP